MAEKVYIVEEGVWDCTPYEGYDDWWTVVVCDTFESACNYIRSRLIEIFNDFKKWYEEHPDCRSESPIENMFRRDYTFDPNNLPDDAQLGMDKTFVTYGDGEDGRGFIIHEHEIKHYD